MKKSHILGIAVIGIAILVIITTAGDASTYVSFHEAEAMPGSKVHVVGTLKTDEQGGIVGIEPSADKLAFSFLMVDNSNNTKRVYYNEPMPPDFQRSEQVVVIGAYRNDQFFADQILLKCPSKYQEEGVRTSAALQ
jgi:cytochrome c-type biogenesis protein CcmE